MLYYSLLGSPIVSLLIFRYFLDILDNTPKSVESVTIDVDGRWSVAVEASNSPMPDTDDEYDDHDDIIEISDSRVSRIKGEITPSSVSPIARSSREPSSIPRGSISNKRPISQVIDLTLSDDDDDDPRPAKRMSSFLTPSSMGSDSRGGLAVFEAMGFDGLSGSSRSPVGNPDSTLSRYGR